MYELSSEHTHTQQHCQQQYHPPKGWSYPYSSARTDRKRQTLQSSNVVVVVVVVWFRGFICCCQTNDSWLCVLMMLQQTDRQWKWTTHGPLRFLTQFVAEAKQKSHMQQGMTHQNFAFATSFYHRHHHHHRHTNFTSNVQSTCCCVLCVLCKTVIYIPSSCSSRK